MNGLYAAHSGLRYLVLLAGAATMLVMLRGMLTGAPYGRPQRVTGAVFTGMLHLQALLGVALLAVRPWYPALAGHLTTMVLAAGLVPVLFGRARRSSDPRRAHHFGAAAAIGGLALLVIGILSIRGSIFASFMVERTPPAVQVKSPGGG